MFYTLCLLFPTKTEFLDPQKYKNLVAMGFYSKVHKKEKLSYTDGFSHLNAF